MNTPVVCDEIQVPSDINFLIVEDMQEIRELLKMQIFDFGFRGKCFEAEGLRKSQEIFNNDAIKIDYILLDWTLTDGKGIKFIQALRKLDEYDKVPILLITANNDIDDLLVAIEEGATDYLIKPWSTEELKSKIAWSWNKQQNV